MSKDLKSLVPSGTWYVPVTPAGTACVWLASTTKQEAIDKLLIDAAHMPYGTWDKFEKRGYTIEKLDGWKP